MARRIKIK